MNAINIYKNLSELSKGFTEFVRRIANEKNSVTISLSGGSTPKALFNYWAENAVSDLPWAKMKFFWGDERCVPPGDAISNFNMTEQHLFSKVPVPKENIFRIKGENDPADEAVRYSEELSQVRMDDGLPQFDLMILGLGDDGHTASVFPHQINLWDSNDYCVVAEHPDSGMKRISMTGKVINNSANVVFLVTGAAKAEKVRDIVRHASEFCDKYPAARVSPHSGNLFWFLDEEAAGLLK